MITIKEYTEQLETENRTLYEDKNYWKRLAEKRKSQLQQKENIIKEVREYLESNDIMKVSKEKETKGSIFCCDKEILEILDKVSDE